MKQDLIQIIHLVQKQVHEDFTFQFHFVGSAEQNMVTCDEGTNVGYDFDVNIQINDKCRFSAKEIKTKIRLALDKVAPVMLKPYTKSVISMVAKVFKVEFHISTTG